MAFMISVANAAPGEGYYSGSVIAGTPFNINVTKTDSSGNVDGSYSGTASVYANSSTSNTAYFLGNVSLYLGQGTLSGATIHSVLGNGSSRKITVTDTYGNSGSLDVGVWFQVTMTVECANDTVASPGYTTQTSCGAQPSGTAFVALPYTTACGTQVSVHSNSTGRTATVPLKDHGPYSTTDNYWNGTGVPSNTQNNNAGIDGSDALWNQLGLTGYSCSYSNPSGNTTVQWRFA